MPTGHRATSSPAPQENDLRLSIPLEFGMRDGGLRATGGGGFPRAGTMLKRLTEACPVT